MDKTPAAPQVDRRQLQQIIAGLTEGIVLIDPERSIVWANETALAVHDVTVLAELGATATDYLEKFTLKYRNHHVLPPKQYPIERVLSGEVFSDVVVEVTRPDKDVFKRVHTVRSLVLNNAADAPESLVVVIQDVTQRFSAEERFEQTFNANPAPALICRFSDLRYVKVNQGFLEMTGYSREDIIGRSTYELDVLEGAEKKEEAIGGFNEGRTIPQMEATLRLPAGGAKFVIVAGQPIEVGEDDCMLFTFIDLELRKKAEHALRQTEERFSKAFRLPPLPIPFIPLQGFRLMEGNDAFVTTTGYAAEEVVARDASDLD